MQVPRASLCGSPHGTSAMMVGVGSLWSSVSDGRAEGVKQMLHNLQPSQDDLQTMVIWQVSVLADDIPNAAGALTSKQTVVRTHGWCKVCP